MGKPAEAPLRHNGLMPSVGAVLAVSPERESPRKGAAASTTRTGCLGQYGGEQSVDLLLGIAGLSRGSLHDLSQIVFAMPSLAVKLLAYVGQVRSEGHT